MILVGDCFEKLKDIEDNSIHSLVTDPPYGLSTVTEQDTRDCLAQWLDDEVYTSKKAGFMGETWDSFVPSPVLFKEVLRVLKPGAYGLVFSGSRTQDLMTMSLRLAGFEIRDCLMWLYGNGFPKSYDASEAFKSPPKSWGTALKPAYEPITLVKKPIKSSIETNIQMHGVGALNLEASRIPLNGISKGKKGKNTKGVTNFAQSKTYDPETARYPANVVLDSSINLNHATRYFYCARSSPEERHKGTDQNIHPTVKPINLMRYLCKLITPEQGTILDPFAGSGSTLCAAVLEGFKPLGIERNPEYAAIAAQRLNHYTLDKEWSLF
tara:strand:+ start:280 stop:1251 length:972 start_codon:yes stop_codon:yes gene_type:complete